MLALKISNLNNTRGKKDYRTNAIKFCFVNGEEVYVLNHYESKVVIISKKQDGDNTIILGHNYKVSKTTSHYVRCFIKDNTGIDLSIKELDKYIGRELNGYKIIYDNELDNIEVNKKY